jgi:hypothetical protein
VTGSDPQHPAIGRGFAWNYFAYMVMGDAKLDLATITDADLARAARRYAPIMDSDSPDLSAFKARGGAMHQR